MSYVNSVTVYPSSATITKGKWYYGAYASISSNCPECAEVEWYSDSPSIASVNKTTGYIYGVNTGKTRIYAIAKDDDSKKDYIEVTVTAPVSVTGVSVCPTSMSMDVGCTDYLYETIYPSNATNQTVTWCSSDESVAEVNTYTGFVRAKKAGVVTITACTVDGGYSACCVVTVNPLLIYQTRDTEVKWFNPDIENATEEIREDMLYNHWSKQEIKQNVSSIGDNMFEKNGQEISVSDRKNSLVDMTTTHFANKTFEPIIKDMINHFMNETDDNFYGMCDGYNLYSNSDLTEQVKSHSESEDYINKNKTALNRCLKNFNGSICNLKYNPSIRHDKDLRKSHPFVAMADSMGIKLPVFDDMFKGFKICIDSLQGAKIEILSYNLVGNSYSGKMKITYYDHFGLDVADLNKDGFAGIVGYMNGFKNWFILQHYNNLNTNIHPKPFVTVIEIEESFSGEI